jgi:energy-coupling factor transporter ATP-binding protein EcfA2
MTYQGLQKVDFGTFVAEEEAVTLANYFLETEAYNTVVDNERVVLVLGRKGSGKSAIYVAIRDLLKKKEHDL